MTEKRFTVIGNIGTDKYSLDNLYDNGTYIGTMSIGSELICYLLNSLNDENKQLKKQVINLKVELDTHKHPLWSTREAERIINEIKDENEQLKKDYQQLHQIESRLRVRIKELEQKRSGV